MCIIYDAQRICRFVYLLSPSLNVKMTDDRLIWQIILSYRFISDSVKKHDVRKASLALNSIQLFYKIG